VFVSVFLAHADDAMLLSPSFRGLQPLFISPVSISRICGNISTEIFYFELGANAVACVFSKTVYSKNFTYLKQ